MRKMLCILFVACLVSAAAAESHKMLSNKGRSVDIELVADSAVILSDDYAEALVSKPEMAKTRLNALKRFYATYSANKPVADTICSRIFDIYVDNVERENVSRANAFKECFLAIADKDNDHLGPLYALELLIAQEQSDTAAIHNILPCLADYADRNEFDYSTEIASAKKFISDFKNRNPINEDIVGVWVGESICHDEYYIPSLAEAFITDIDGNKEKHDDLSRAVHILLVTNSEVVPVFGCGSVEYCDFPLVNYKIPQEEECLKFFRKKKSYFFERCASPSWLYKDDYYEFHPQFKEYDEKFRSAYFLWSNEKIQGFNPQYFATLRQSLQNSHASNIGELSRSSVKTGTRVKWHLISQSMYSIGNSVLDYLAVSTAYSWIREMTLTLLTPTTMKVWNHLQFNVSKSNSNRVNSKEADNSSLYLKWVPQDNVFFLWQNGNHITLGEETKLQKKANKEFVKQEKKRFEESFGKIGMSQKKYDEFRRWFNTQMFNKLKKSDI